MGEEAREEGVRCRRDAKDERVGRRVSPTIGISFIHPPCRRAAPLLTSAMTSAGAMLTDLISIVIRCAAAVRACASGVANSSGSTFEYNTNRRLPTYF